MMFSATRAILLFLSVALFTIVLAPQQGFAQNCPRHKTIMILDPEITKTLYFRGSAKRLTEWTMGHTQTVGVVLGLGGGEIGTKFQAAFQYSTTPEGLVCVQLDKVRAIFYAHPRMYIANDYKKGSCEYEAIIEHERRHVEALIKFHEEHTERFRTHMGRIAKRIPLFGPVTPGEIPYIKERLMQYVMGEYNSYQNKQLMSLQRQQQKIDSPSEYRGVAKKCDNW